MGDLSKAQEEVGMGVEQGNRIEKNLGRPPSSLVRAWRGSACGHDTLWDCLAFSATVFLKEAMLPRIQDP